MRNGGFALISVLVILAILTPLVVNLSYSTRVQMAGADFFAGKVRSREVARAGLESAILALKNDDTEYDSYLDEWGQFEELSRFSGTFFEEGGFAGRIEDEEGKININHLLTAGAINPQVENHLLRLFDLIDVDTDILDAVVDWLDEDSEVELAGAEDDYYSTLDNPYFSKDGPMDNLYELRLIRGVTDDIFHGKVSDNGLVHFLSAYGGDFRVNINTAPPEVLESLSGEMDASIVEEIVAYREEEPFRNIEELRDVAGMDMETFDAVKGKIKVKSSYFSITVRGMVRDIYTDIHVVVKRDNEKLKIVYYNEA